MIEVDGGLLRLEGPLTMATVGAVLEAGRQQVAAADCVIDLSAVSTADSAALALLFDWLRTARKHGRCLAVRGMPDGLRSLAAVYGAATLLPPEG
ncbi:STAS domain-containing protein [Pseudothauera hydrothermalis]|jgi:phospholipid transport system transporter-binding protein|uniref:STAS domain-containing protein n=1 Tax=Pseudothauera hydrothermalis TaxID=2184083 RepID=UPI000C7E7965|nr:STAS domain-containing protein [Pseudothauera hydrothermalis]AUM00760.1 NTP-binding protein [Rhodocyclaceae bacterium]